LKDRRKAAFLLFGLNNDVALWPTAEIKAKPTFPALSGAKRTSPGKSLTSANDPYATWAEPNHLTVRYGTATRNTLARCSRTFVSDEHSKVYGRHRHWYASEVCKLRLTLRVGESRVDLRVGLVGDFVGRPFRRADSEPGCCHITGHKFTHRRDVRQCRRRVAGLPSGTEASGILRNHSLGNESRQFPVICYSNLQSGGNPL
jgi:hypothetical protein